MYVPFAKYTSFASLTLMLLSLVKSILKELIHDVVYYSDASELMMSTGITASLHSTFSSNCVTSDQTKANTVLEERQQNRIFGWIFEFENIVIHYNCGPNDRSCGLDFDASRTLDLMLGK